MVQPMTLGQIILPLTKTALYECNLSDQPTRLCRSPSAKKTTFPFSLHSSEVDTDLFDCPVDLIDAPGEIIIRADFPGFPKDSIDISVDANGNLQILASRSPVALDEKEKAGDKDKLNYVLQERLTPEKVGRRIQLPRDAQLERIQASFVDGVLDIRMLKEQPQKRQIQIA
jgi:HSP20 family molecular chaperone IbpA